MLLWERRHCWIVLCLSQYACQMRCRFTDDALYVPKSQEATRRLLADTTSFMHHHFYPSMIIDKIMFQCLFLVSGCQNQLRNPIIFYRHTGRLLVVQYHSFVRYTGCEDDTDVVTPIYDL